MSSESGLGKIQIIDKTNGSVLFEAEVTDVKIMQANQDEKMEFKTNQGWTGTIVMTNIKPEYVFPEPEPQPPYTQKSFFLSKEGEDIILGLHQVGEMMPTDQEDLSKVEFMAMESWINVYDKEMNFRYSAARFSGPMETEVKGYTDEGWVVVKQEIVQGDPV